MLLPIISALVRYYFGSPPSESPARSPRHVYYPFSDAATPCNSEATTPSLIELPNPNPNLRPGLPCAALPGLQTTSFYQRPGLNLDLEPQRRPCVPPRCHHSDNLSPSRTAGRDWAISLVSSSLSSLVKIIQPLNLATNPLLGLRRPF